MRVDLSENELRVARMVAVERQLYGRRNYEDKKKFEYSPTLRELAYLRGKMGIGNTKRIVDQLVRIGAVKKVGKRGRTIRPVYINFRNLS